MKINWQCYDGYVGGSRPQVANLDEEELLDCETEEEVEELIERAVEEAFREKVSYAYDNKETAKVIQRWQELKAKQAEEEEE